MLQRRRYPTEIALNLTLDSTVIRTLSRVISWSHRDRHRCCCWNIRVSGSIRRDRKCNKGESSPLQSFPLRRSYEQSKSTIGSIVIARKWISEFLYTRRKSQVSQNTFIWRRYVWKASNCLLRVLSEPPILHLEAAALEVNPNSEYIRIFRCWITRCQDWNKSNSDNENEYTINRKFKIPRSFLFHIIKLKCIYIYITLKIIT